jgi:hypothetical protein
MCLGYFAWIGATDAPHLSAAGMFEVEFVTWPALRPAAATREFKGISLVPDCKYPLCGDDLRAATVAMGRRPTLGEERLG